MLPDRATNPHEDENARLRAFVGPDDAPLAKALLWRLVTNGTSDRGYYAEGGFRLDDDVDDDAVLTTWPESDWLALALCVDVGRLDALVEAMCHHGILRFVGADFYGVRVVELWPRVAA